MNNTEFLSLFDMYQVQEICRKANYCKGTNNVSFHKCSYLSSDKLQLSINFNEIILVIANFAFWCILKIVDSDCTCEKTQNLQGVTNSAELNQKVCSAFYMDQVMRKCVLWHMQTTKVQISLRIGAVRSAPLLFAA